jgi:hypothetical protein
MSILRNWGQLLCFTIGAAISFYSWRERGVAGDISTAILAVGFLLTGVKLREIAKRVADK